MNIHVSPEEIYENAYENLSSIPNITTISHLEKNNHNILLIGEIHSTERKSKQYVKVSKFINRFVKEYDLDVDLLLEQCVNDESEFRFGAVHKYCRDNSYINVIKCDERPNVPLIVCLSRKDLYEIEEVLENMICLLDIFTKNEDAFIKYIQVLHTMYKYPLTKTNVTLIREIHAKNMQLYRDKFKNIFHNAFRELMNDHNKQNIDIHLKEFLVISQLFFSIILDWAMLYHLQVDSKFKICYAGDIHIQNLRTCLLKLGYVEKYSK